MSRPTLRLLPRLGAPRGCPEQTNRPRRPSSARATETQLPLFVARALEGAERELDHWIEEGQLAAQMEAAWD